ncbi:acetylxylan esterase [Occultella glacieicola]|uniref:Acetylxylan esterase n=1 Tax=Occultella glacieicola TaxID=2518684 RepID=A0ABY2E639_9MICO|nr:acetylxylan esterase [Occultella glacieicola]TDE96066.1 acetylxylan esterase [Occultella glacieicola]
MVQFDLPLEQLRTYRNPRPAPPGLAEYWDRTLEESRAAAGPVRTERVDAGLRTVTCDDVSFPGFAGEPVRAWWLVPDGVADPGTDGGRPVVVEFLGYGGGRGLPHERLIWASHGFAQLVVDSRGQGGIWNTGDTPDPHGSAAGSVGLLTKGVDHPDHLYYRRLLTDAALAVDAVAHLPGADPSRIATVGHSQGGGLALAAAALNPAVAAVGARAPFLCGIARAVEVTDAEPYGDLARYLAVHRTRVEEVLAVLDHVDVSFLTPRLTCPTWISVGLADAICPPSGIFGAINAIEAVAPEVRTWPYGGHEAGGAHDDAHLAGWLADRLRRAAAGPETLPAKLPTQGQP